VEVLTDCGSTFAGTLFDKAGSALATAPAVTDFFIPDEADDWEHVVLDMSDYAGNSVTVRFANITGYGNSLVIDNVRIREMLAPSNAQIITDGAAIPCEGDFIVFEAEAEGDFLEYEWDFGPEAWPQTKTGPGPHSILFGVAGTYEVTLTVSNQLGTITTTKTIEITPYPVPAIEADVVGQVVTFTNASQHADEVLWDFGDGETTTIENPVHVYLQTGVYVVKLTATNDCGAKTTSDTLYIGVNATTDMEKRYQFELHPNPASSQVTLSLLGPAGKEVSVALYDLHGRKLREETLGLQPAPVQRSWPLDLPKGVYLMRLQDETGVLVRRLVIQ